MIREATLRRPQAEFQELCRQLVAGEVPDLEQVVCAVAPGGGKSKLPVIAASMLIPEFCDKILWIVPRDSLKEQGEREFLDPRLPTSRRMRASNGNEPNPDRGSDGYITTYQAVGMSPEEHLGYCKRQRVVVFCDEGHHVADDASWAEGMEPIRKAAKLVVDMSGTLSRNDGREIHGMYYQNGLVNLKSNVKTAVITYTRSEAMRDGNILPVDLVSIDGAAKWINKMGIEREVDSLQNVYDNERFEAVYTVLRTDFAFQVIQTCLDHWQEHKKVYQAAKMLVVAPDIKTAKLYHGFVADRHLAMIATSEDKLGAMRAIREFKRGTVEVLITVGMAYEGLSVPEITHIACLTQIRSKEWLEQMQARGNRCALGKQQSWCLAPRDPRMIEAWRKIEEEVLTPLATMEDDDWTLPNEASSGGDGEGGGLQNFGIQPLWSEAHGVQVIDVSKTPSAIAGLTISEQERILRDNIRAIRRVVVEQAKPGSVMAYATIWSRTVKGVARKELDHMTLDELNEVYKKVRTAFKTKIEI